MVKKFGITCRSQEDEVAGLFVNTDSAGYCRESKFQAIKIEKAIREGKITKDLIKKLEFENGVELVRYISSLKGDEASRFTRNNGLQNITPTGWKEGENIKVMEEIQRDFIVNGGLRGKDYLITLIALHKENLGIIESSRTDDKWAIKADTANQAGKGLNNLGKIHMKLQTEFGDQNIRRLNEIFPSLDIRDNEIQEKIKYIRDLVKQNTLNVMSIKEKNNEHIVNPASKEYLDKNLKSRINSTNPSSVLNSSNNNLSSFSNSMNTDASTQKMQNNDSSTKSFNIVNFLGTFILVSTCITIALNMPIFAPFIAEIGKYSLISNITNFVSPLISGLANLTNISKNTATSLSYGAIAGTVEQAVEFSINSANKWSNRIKTKNDNYKAR